MAKICSGTFPLNCGRSFWRKPSSQQNRPLLREQRKIRLHSIGTKTKQQDIPAPSTETIIVDSVDSLIKNEQISISDGLVQKGSVLGAFIEKIRNQMKMSERMQALILLNVMTIIMSTNFVVVKEAQTAIDPFSFSAARFVTAAIPFLPIIWRSQPDQQLIFAGVEIGMWSALGYLTQGLGLLTTDASRVSFLSALTVILVPIIVGLSGKGVSKFAWPSAAVAMIGVSLLSNDTSLGNSNTFSIGDFYSLISAAFIAVQIIRTEHYSALLPAKKYLSLLGLSVLSIATISTLAAIGYNAESISSMFDVLQNSDDALNSLLQWVPVSFIPGKALLYTGLVSTDIVLLLELIALKNVRSTDAAVIYTAEPVLGALWAYLLLGERWGPNGWVGAALILASSFATQIYGGHEVKEKTKD